MSQTELLITRIDRRLRSIHHELSLVARTGRTTNLAQEPLLSEYIKLTDTDGIIPAIQYIALDGLATHFNLYEDDRDRQQILAAQADELTQSQGSEILASLEIIYYTCPVIANICQTQLILTKERTIRSITGLNIIVREVDRQGKTSNVGAKKDLAISATRLNISKTLKLNKIFASTIAGTSFIVAFNLIISSLNGIITTPSAIQDNIAIDTSSKNINNKINLSSQSYSNLNDKKQEEALSAISHISQCAFLSHINARGEIISYDCDISKKTNKNIYELVRYSDKKLYTIELKDDSKAIINGEDAQITQINNNGVTISFSEGRIAWIVK